MFTRLALAYIWLVGIRDWYLSRALIHTTGLDAELNLLARWVVEKIGPDALGPFKLASLLIFTAAVLLVNRRQPRLARLVLGIGVIVYALLSAWWDIVLTASMQSCQS